MWASYTGHVNATLTTPPTSKDDIDAAAWLLASQVGPKLGESWLAFASLVAAGSERFAEAVRAEADAAPGGREAWIASLKDEPWLPSRLNGARQAAALAAMALQSTQTPDALARVRAYGYGLQNTDWAKAVITDNSDFLSTFTQAQALEARRHQQLVDYMNGMTPVGHVRFHIDANQRQFYPGPFRNIVRNGVKEQVLALAAMRVLNADRTHPDQARAMLKLERTRSCFAAAARNMSQCTSANRRAYERAACIAQHQIEEPLACASVDVAANSIAAALEARNAPSHVGVPVGGAAVPVVRGPLSSSGQIGLIPVDGEAQIVDVMGSPAPRWYRIRGFQTVAGTASTVDGWVQPAAVRAWRKADTPE